MLRVKYREKQGGIHMVGFEAWREQLVERLKNLSWMLKLTTLRLNSA